MLNNCGVNDDKKLWSLDSTGGILRKTKKNVNANVTRYSIAQPLFGRMQQAQKYLTKFCVIYSIYM